MAKRDFVDAAQLQGAKDAREFIATVKKMLASPDGRESVKLDILVPMMVDEKTLQQAVKLCKADDWDVEVERYDDGTRFINCT